MSQERDLAEFMPLAEKALGSALRKVPPHTDRDELWSAVMAGLLEAHHRHDPAKGKFENYAWRLMQVRILDALRRMDWLPRNARQMFKRMGRMRQEFEQTHGRAPTDDDMATLMGVSAAEYHRLRDYATPAKIMSLDEALGDESSDDCQLHNVVAEPEPDPIRANLPELLALIERALPLLEQREAHVVRRYYFEEVKMADIGAEMGVTESRICQIHQAAIAAMRILFGRWEKRGFMPVPFAFSKDERPRAQTIRPMSKIRWTQRELDALADEFVRQRVAQPFNSVGQVLHDTQRVALPPERRRSLPGITVIGNDFLAGIRQRMNKLMEPPVAAPSAPAVVPPPERMVEREAVPVPTIVEVKVATGTTAPPPDREAVLRGCSPGFLMGFAMERVLQNMAAAMVSGDAGMAATVASAPPAAPSPEQPPANGTAVTGYSGSNGRRRIMIIGLPRDQREKFRFECDKQLPNLNVMIFSPGELAPKLECDYAFVVTQFVGNTQAMLARNQYGDRVVALDRFTDLMPRLLVLNGS